MEVCKKLCKEVTGSQAKKQQGIRQKCMQEMWQGTLQKVSKKLVWNQSIYYATKPAKNQARQEAKYQRVTRQESKQRKQQDIRKESRQKWQGNREKRLQENTLNQKKNFWKKSRRELGKIVLNKD